MEALNLHEKFDFDAFMRNRGWSSLISMVLWIMLFAIIVFKTFNPQF